MQWPWTSPWRQTTIVSFFASSAFPSKTGRNSSLRVLLYFEDFFFFYGAEVFDLLGFGVSELFELVERAFLLVLADFLLFFQFIDGFLDVAPNIAHGGAVILEDFVQVLDDVLAAILRQRGNRYPDNFSIVRGIESEIGRANRLVDQRHGARIPGRDDDRHRLGHRERAELVHRH